MSAYRLIEAQKARATPSQCYCRVLEVLRSGYYGWKDRPPSKRDQENAALTQKIREVHDRSPRTYGATRGCMPSLRPWECVALPSALPD